ncbi:MAG: hypothetical protein KJZ80_14325 [Hyphomicrobiaceae bacterium]|nr:hypothetical protein [Hyphomicrobiaceae bacterium]
MLIGAVLLAGCSSDGSLLGSQLTTASVPETPKIDPVCVSLTAQIDGLMKEGVAEKIEKAAAKKYKMKAADLVKADQLNKANADFQNRCAINPITPTVTTAAAKPAAAAGQSAAVATARPAAPAQTPLVRPADGP